MCVLGSFPAGVKKAAFFKTNAVIDGITIEQW
jgi:hypothetical protein